MNCLEIAEEEVDRAIKVESPDWDGKSFNYTASVYKSALKAFKSLCHDEHSGMSIMFTKNILNRLIDGQPLTPIEDADFLVGDELNNIYFHMDKSYLEEHGFKDEWQCPRMPSLFRTEHLDGSITYTDVSRYYCFDVNSDSTFTTGLVSRLIDKMFPITMPYYPPAGKYKVAIEDICKDCSSYGLHIIYIQKPDGESVYVDKYYIYTDGGDIECTKEEFEQEKVKILGA